MIEKIDAINKKVFEYDTKDLAKDTTDLFTDILNNGLVGGGQGRIGANAFNRIMEKCLVALQNSDFLLLADVLEYELKAGLYAGK